MKKTKHIQRIYRHRRLRAKVKGTSTCPRLSVYRSNKHMLLQLIDDNTHKTLIAVSDRDIKISGKKTKSDYSYEAGKLIADRAKKINITHVVFDRGGYRYHGRVARAAVGAREGGLTF